MRQTFLKTVEPRPGETAREFGSRVREAVRASKVVHIGGVSRAGDDLRTFYEQVQEAIGRPLSIGEDPRSGEPTGERWISICFDVRHPDRYRCANVAQPLHTDYAYTADNPELALLYCVRSAPRGGETIFIDAEVIVDLLEEHDPVLLDELRRREVHFFKAGRGKIDRIISSDESGTLLTWLHSCVHPEQSPEVRAMAARFANFLDRIALQSERLAAIRLGAGEAVVWHDRRLLHGRHGFEAGRNGDRFLWKGAIYLEPDGAAARIEARAAG